MGCTRSELLARCTSAELAELRSLMVVEPMGYERLDHYLTQLVMVWAPKNTSIYDVNLSLRGQDPKQQVDVNVDAQLAKWGR